MKHSPCRVNWGGEFATLQLHFAIETCYCKFTAQILTRYSVQTDASMISVAYSDTSISLTSVKSPPRTSSSSSTTRANFRRAVSNPLSSSTRSSLSSVQSDVSTSTAATARDDTLVTQAASKKYRFDAAPKLVKTPWEADRSKRAFPRQWQGDGVAARPSTSRGQPSILSQRVFKVLPAEVYDCILEQMDQLAFSEKSGACLSCYLADLYSLCLVSRTWEARARQKL
jgi:hypothetical protein